MSNPPELSAAAWMSPEQAGTANTMALTLRTIWRLLLVCPFFSPCSSAGKKIPRLLIFLLALVAPGVVAQTRVEVPRTIRVVIDNAYAPYSFQSDDGKLQGILIDQWQAWEKKTGIKVEIHAMDWGEALRRMRAGEFDVIDSIVETAERRDYFDFTPAYTPIEASIFFRKDISGISDLTSLKGFPVAVKAGDQHIDQLKANGVTTLILFPNNEAIIEAAQQRKINVFVVDDPSALYLLNKLGVEGEFRHSAPVFRDGLRRAVRKGDAATLHMVSEGFAAIDAGELKLIDEKWFGRTINRDGRYLTYAGYAAVLAVLLIAVLLAWNSMLRKRVLQRTALLFAKEQEFRAIVENAPDQIIRYDRNFRRAYVNPAVVRAYGLPREALIGKPIGSVIEDAGIDVKEDELTQLRQQIANVFDSGQSYECELSWPLPTGRTPFSVRLFPELDLHGSVINVLGISRDITESKRAEEELKKEKEVLEKIFDNIPVLIGFVGEDGQVKLVNPEWERTMGWTLKELQEQNVDIFAEAYPDLPYRQEVLNFVTAAKGEWVELKIRVRDGRVIDAACAVVRLSDGTKVAIARDITERKRAEERIKATSEQLRALSARLQAAKEEEDIRIARELHDEMGSTLTSLRWELERLDQTISEAKDWSQRQSLRSAVADMIKVTDTTIGIMRRIASELRPSILDNLGLPEAIEWQAQQFQIRTGIVCDYDCSLENLNLDPEQSTAVFRIFQEALTNILRHARATRVEIAVREEDGRFILTISDNGRGITEDEKAGRLSLGILGMRERAHLIGGEFEITGLEGKGTLVTVRVPLSAKQTAGTGS